MTTFSWNFRSLSTFCKKKKASLSHLFLSNLSAAPRAFNVPLTCLSLNIVWLSLYQGNKDPSVFIAMYFVNVFTKYRGGSGASWCSVLQHRLLLLDEELHHLLFQVGLLHVVRVQPVPKREHLTIQVHSRYSFPGRCFTQYLTTCLVSNKRYRNIWGTTVRDGKFA